MRRWPILLILFGAAICAVPEAHAARATDVVEIDIREQIGEFSSAEDGSGALAESAEPRGRGGRRGRRRG